MVKKIILCGNPDYTGALLKAIEQGTERFSVSMPVVVIESEDSEKLIELAKNETFPIFILDKNLPSQKLEYRDGLVLASKIRMVRNESSENYWNPSDKEAGIVVYSEDRYNGIERNGQHFWASNMYLIKNIQANDEDIAELCLGTTIFNNEWVLPQIWSKLRAKFSQQAR